MCVCQHSVIFFIITFLCICFLSFQNRALEECLKVVEVCAAKHAELFKANSELVKQAEAARR
jgi:hypothetical protein